MNRQLPFIAILVCSLLGKANAAANEKYFLIVFGANNGKPKVSHTWATFIRVAGADSDSLPRVDQWTISWLPVNGVVTPRLLGGGERGRNFTLEESMQWAKSHEIAVVAWGPVEIRKDLFDRALARKDMLDRGELSYRMLDRPGRNATVSNCIHAVSDVVPGPPLITRVTYGVEASALVANHLRPHMIRPEVNHMGLVSRVGLDKHAVQYMSLR